MSGTKNVKRRRVNGVQRLDVGHPTNNTANTAPRSFANDSVEKWRETCRTIRVALIGSFTLAGIAIVTWGVVATTAVWWKVLLFTAAPPLSLVGSVILLLKKRLAPVIEDFSKRSRESEKLVDKNRESSELREDGSYPDD